MKRILVISVFVLGLGFSACTGTGGGKYTCPTYLKAAPIDHNDDRAQVEKKEAEDSRS